MLQDGFTKFVGMEKTWKNSDSSDVKGSFSSQGAELIPPLEKKNGGFRKFERSCVTSDSRLYFWLVRKKLYHIPLWLAYEIITGVIFSAQLGWNWRSAVIVIFYALGHATGSYINIYYLIPKYLNAKSYLKYLVGFLLNFALSPLIIAIGFAITFGLNESFFAFLSSRLFVKAVYSSSFSTIVGVMIFSMTSDWFASQKRNQQLEKERLEAELKFLRSQFNPHFLFNTINSIFFLIQKDQEKASDSLAKFSELLRYQLYECNETLISLNHEVPYLQNFIELEKLRHDPALKVEFQVERKPYQESEIAPFLLMPFVENAFK